MRANEINASSAGIQSLTSSGVFNGRTITGTSNQITVSNGDGTAGNPTIALTSTIYISGISWNSGTNSISSFTEGTWTPSLSLVTPGTSSFSYTTQIGRYYQLGNMVILNLNIILSSFTLGTGTGNVNITTLPFTPGRKTEMPVITAEATIPATVKFMSFQCNTSSTTAAVLTTRNGSGSTTYNNGFLNNTSTIKSTGYLSIA